MSFNAICENKILAKISNSTVIILNLDQWFLRFFWALALVALFFGGAETFVQYL